MSGKSAGPSISAVLIVAVLLLASVAAAVAVWAIRPYGESGSGLPDSFSYRVDDYASVAPDLLRWQEVLAIPLTLERAQNLAVGPDDRVYVVGDRALVWFNSDGKPAGRIELDAEPRAVAVAADGHATRGHGYLAFADHVEVYRPDGSRVAVWPKFGENALLSAIVLGENEIFLADAGRRVVLRCDREGNILGEIGRRDDAKGIDGVVIYSPYFDLAVGADGLLRMVNPGRHRIEYYTMDGRLEQPLTWGRAGAGIDGFSGCCNPVSIAVLSDGRMVTAEKGLPRVKVYDGEGQLLSVVAGPHDLLPPGAAIDETRAGLRSRPPMVAADSRDRVLILDSAAKAVRIFKEKP